MIAIWHWVGRRAVHMNAVRLFGVGLHKCGGIDRVVDCWGWG